MVAVTRGDLETIRLLLAEIVLRTAGGVLEFDIVPKTQVLSDSGTYLKTHPQWPPASILDN